MSKYLVFLLLNFGAVFIANAVKTKGNSSPYKVYPLILFETYDNALRRPFDMDINQYFLCFFKSYNFGANEAKKELLFCPATNQDKHKIETIKRNTEQNNDLVNDYCLFERTGSPWLVVIDIFRADVPRCTTEPEPFISRIFPNKNAKDSDQENVSLAQEAVPCGPDEKGKLYRYGYQIWLREGLLDRVGSRLDSGLFKSNVYPDKDIIDYEIYRFCYDAEDSKVLYTKHKIISPKLLYQKHILKREQHKPYDICSKNFDLKDLNFEKRANKYSKYLKQKQKEDEEISASEIPQKTNYILEQLVPASDFSFALWRKPTFHYVNVELMHKQLLGLWNHILKAVQKQAEKSGVEFNIYTKAFNMPNELSKEQNNFEETKTFLESPQVWIKIIHHYFEGDFYTINQALAIIVNNELSATLNEKISNTFCKIDLCKTVNDFRSTKYPNVKQYMRCCAVDKKIAKLFNLDISLNYKSEKLDNLWLEELTDTNTKDSNSVESKEYDNKA